MIKGFDRIMFDVPYNGDPELIQFYIKHKKYIEMVYWRAEDWYPQWRKTNTGKCITLQDIFEENKKLAIEGITFNYLLNGTSHGNQEYDPKYRKKFIKHVRYLKDNGIRMVTIGNLFLLEAVINEVKWINVAASILLEIDSLVKVQTMYDLWVRCIFLSKVILKNFNALKNIHEFNKKHPDLKLFLLANDPCLNHCLYTNYHNETLSLLTGSNKQCNSFCRMQCTKRFISDPQTIIKSSFIRPEDLLIYSNIWFKLIKLCDRKQTTIWIKNMLRAYIEKKYDGYISDIMAPWSRHNGEYPKTIKIHMLDFIKNGYDSYRDYLRFSPRIKNRDLDNYLDFFVKNKPNWCNNEDCSKCWYCTSVAMKLWLATEKILKMNLTNAVKACFK